MSLDDQHETSYGWRWETHTHGFSLNAPDHRLLYSCFFSCLKSELRSTSKHSLEFNLKLNSHGISVSRWGQDTSVMIILLRTRLFFTFCWGEASNLKHLLWRHRRHLLFCTHSFLSGLFSYTCAVVNEVLSSVVEDVGHAVNRNITGAQILHELLSAPWLRALLKVRAGSAGVNWNRRLSTVKTWHLSMFCLHRFMSVWWSFRDWHPAPFCLTPQGSHLRFKYTHTHSPVSTAVDNRKHTLHVSIIISAQNWFCHFEERSRNLSSKRILQCPVSWWAHTGAGIHLVI